MSDGVYFVDQERRILYWNDGARRLTGYAADELVGRRCQDDILCHIDGEGKRLCQEGCPLTASIEDGGMHQASVFLRHKQGRRVPVNVRVQPIKDAQGAVIGAIEIFSDDTAQNESRRKAEAMRRMAFIDHLTQLPNRRFLEMSVKTAHTEFTVHGDPFGLLVMDLDEFKNINDMHGHACGDRALREVGKTLLGALRPTDSVGRWGGDEFAGDCAQCEPAEPAQACSPVLEPGGADVCSHFGRALDFAFHLSGRGAGWGRRNTRGTDAAGGQAHVPEQVGGTRVRHNRITYLDEEQWAGKGKSRIADGSGVS